MGISKPHLRAVIEESGVEAEVARVRGYRTVREERELVELGFTEYQAKVPALLVPIYRPNEAEPSLHQSRPDSPRTEIRNGRRKEIKYETPAGARMALDVHPSMHEAVKDPTRPLFVTEGVKKGDSLTSRGLCAVSLIGVWNWRGTNPQGGKTALPEWEDVALNGREVYIVFDSDVMLKPEVHAALARLKAFLERRGADVAVIYLPVGAGGRKQGVDDYLASGRTTAELLSHATGRLRVMEVVKGERPEATPAVISSAVDLMARRLPPVRWVVPGILPEGVTLLAGKAKIRKSWLSMGLCTAVAAGGVAFGKVSVERGSSLYLALEDNERRMQSRLGKILGRSSAPAGFDYATAFPRINEGGLDALAGWLDATPDARLVVIDTLQKFRPRSTGQNGYQEDYEALEPLLPLAAEHQVAIVVVAHLRKAGAADPIDEVNATSGLTGGVDGIIVFKGQRGKPDATMFVTGREIEEEGELSLRWDRELHGWMIVGDAEETRLTEERRALLEFLRAAGGPVAVKELVKGLGKSQPAVSNLLGKLAFDGLVERVGRGRWQLALRKESSPLFVSGDESGDEGNPHGNAENPPIITTITDITAKQTYEETPNTGDSGDNGDEQDVSPANSEDQIITGSSPLIGDDDIHQHPPECDCWLCGDEDE